MRDTTLDSSAAAAGYGARVARVLVTGMSGAGKTTVPAAAFSSVARLRSWIEAVLTGDPVGHSPRTTLRSLSSSRMRSISVMRPSMTVIPMTPGWRPGARTTRPAAPLTTAGEQYGM